MPSHFNKGDINNRIALILSTPGKVEGEAECPAAGDTGDNMNGILEILNRNDPLNFPSVNRYHYLITNASTKVMHSTKDNKNTEDLNSNITEQKNLDRILNEITSCTIAILCGKKAFLLASHLRGKILIMTPHLGNKGLRNEYRNNNNYLNKIKNGKERDVARLKLSAESVLHQLRMQLTQAAGCKYKIE